MRVKWLDCGIILSSILLIFSTTVASTSTSDAAIQPIALPDVPQNALHYVVDSQTLLSGQKQAQAAASTLQKMFSPWDMRGSVFTDVKKTVQNTLARYQHVNAYYAFNFHHVEKDWLAGVEKNMNLANFPNNNQNAIVISSTYLRELPTDLPIYNDYRQAGEGFPFDNLQVSSFWAGTPLRVYHVSEDGVWALVSDSELTGWVKVSDIAFVDPSFIKKYRSLPFVAMTKDNIAVKNAEGLGLFKTRIGMLLPLLKGKVAAPLIDENHRAVLKPIALSDRYYQPYPIALTPKKVALLINDMLGEPYGWGGLYYFRDCSLTLKNLFLPFGIDLPRNSAAQGKSGKVISLLHLTNAEKKAVIAAKGKPFFTLLHKSGHIILYLGSENGEPIIFQNKWGLPTRYADGEQGRVILGEAHISPISFGRHTKYVTATLLDDVDEM